MQVLGGFIAVLGTAAVAIAFILLSGTTCGITAAFGIAGILAGLGLFAVGSINQSEEKQVTQGQALTP